MNNSSAPSQGSKASQPIGVKKAKKRAKSEAEHSISVPLAGGVQVMEAKGITTMPKKLAGCWCLQGTCGNETEGDQRQCSC